MTWGGVENRETHEASIFWSYLASQMETVLGSEWAGKLSENPFRLYIKELELFTGF